MQNTLAKFFNLNVFKVKSVYHPNSLGVSIFPMRTHINIFLFKKLASTFYELKKIIKIKYTKIKRASISVRVLV